MRDISILFKPRPKPADPRDVFKEAASRAGRILAARRRTVVKTSGPDKRRWTGVVFNRRAWVGEPVVLPDKSVGWIRQAQAGHVCVRTSAFDESIGAVHQYLDASLLTPFRTPEAVLLGGLKRGTKEKRSAVKAAAARLNGAKPPKAGSRRRGRPRKSSPSANP